MESETITLSQIIYYWKKKKIKAQHQYSKSMKLQRKEKLCFGLHQGSPNQGAPKDHESPAGLFYK